MTSTTLYYQDAKSDKVYRVWIEGRAAGHRARCDARTHGWVLNMGGRHGTPGIASESNIVKVVG